MLPRLPLFHAFCTLHAQCVKSFTTHYRQIHSALPKLPKCTKFSKNIPTIYNHHLPVLWSISQLTRMVLSLDHVPMLLLQFPSHPYFLPLVEGPKLGLLLLFGKLLQGEFHLFQPDWGWSFSPTHVRQIVALIMHIVYVIEDVW